MDHHALLYSHAVVQAARVGLPLHWEEDIMTFTAPGHDDWIIGWCPNTFNQLRIKVMRFHQPEDAYPDIKREC